MKDGAFELTKWKSNDEQHQNPIPTLGKNDYIKFPWTELGTSDYRQNPVLGVNWDINANVQTWTLFRVPFEPYVCIDIYLVMYKNKTHKQKKQHMFYWKEKTYWTGNLWLNI